MSNSLQVFESRPQQWKHWVLTTGLPGIFSIYPFRLEFSLDICLGVGLLDHITALLLGFFLFFFLRNFHPILLGGCTNFTFPPTRVPLPPHSSRSSPVFIICRLFGWMNRMACRTLVPQLGIESGPLQWKPWVLTTGPPRCFLILKFR